MGKIFDSLAFYRVITKNHRKNYDYGKETGSKIIMEKYILEKQFWKLAN